MDEIETRMQGSDISAAILTVPAPVAQPITDRLIQCNIKGILNFTPARLNVPTSIRIHHIDLAVEITVTHLLLKKLSINR